MSSQTGESKRRIGRQTPRVHISPPYEYSDGDDCAFLASGYGLTPDPWQKLVLDDWLGRDENDDYTATRCGLSVPRQNGKNAIIEMRELYGAVTMGEKILHTAHEVRTHRKAFARFCSFFENERKYPELAAMVDTIRKANGQEAVTFLNGGSVEFSARSKSAGRGFSVDVVVFDEAQYLTDEQLSAIMSTLAAAPLGNRQLIFTGTPPEPGSAGEVFTRIRKEALTKPSATLAWHEWSAEDIGDVRDRGRWYDTNPGLGIRLTEEFTEEEMRTMADDSFARERLGWWSKTGGNKVLSESEWNALVTANPPTEGKHAMGIKFSAANAPYGATVSIAMAIRPEVGTPYVEVIANRPMSQGITWIVELLEAWQEKLACVVIDGRNGSGVLNDRLNEIGFPKRAKKFTNTNEVATAASSFLSAIREKKVTHSNQEALNDSALNSCKRSIGEAWGFGGTGDTDSTLIEACTLAHWGVMTTKRNPNRKQRIG